MSKLSLKGHRIEGKGSAHRVVAGVIALIAKIVAAIVATP